MCGFMLNLSSNKNTTNNTNNAPTFLKSNYKYKRRFWKIYFAPMSTSSPLCLKGNLIPDKVNCRESGRLECSNAKNNNDNMIIYHNHQISVNVLDKSEPYQRKEITYKIMLILRLFIFFVVGKVIQSRHDGGNDFMGRAEMRQEEQKSRCRNYDKLSTRYAAAAATSHQLDIAKRSDDSGRNSGSSGSISGSHLQALLLWLLVLPHRLSATPSICRCRRANVLSTLTAFLFMTLALNAHQAEAGACWRSSNSNGKCSEIYLRNSTKAECCKYPDLYYTDRDVGDVEFFFATAVDNGLTCSPCVESCKNVQCGWNKKCVKRKGRPKCVCAPECGSAARHRRQRDQVKQFRGHKPHSEELRLGARTHIMMSRVGSEQRQLEEQLQSQEGEVFAAESSKSPRDIRSLSSEITNINLGVAPHQMQVQNQNQRKMLQIMQSQQSQQKPQTHKHAPKSGRLLITASNSAGSSVEEPGAAATASTRRLQILSNVRPPPNYDASDSTEADGDADFDAEADSEYDSIDDVDVVDDDEDDVGDVDDDNADVNADAVTVNNHDNGDGDGDGEADRRIDKTRMSRHRANKQQRRFKNEMQRENMASGNNNNNGNNILYRHKHQHARRRLENAPNRIKAAAAEATDADDNNNSSNNSGRQREQRQRKRKHQRHKKQRPHDQQRSRKQKNQKDHNRSNQNNNADTHRLFATAESSSSSVAAAHDNFGGVAAAPIHGNATMFAYPSSSSVVSLSSAERRLFNHGSHHTKSSTMLVPQHQLQQHLSAKSSEAFFSGVDGSKSSVNSDDFTLLDGIYDNYHAYGFPNRQNELMFEHLHGAHPVCGTDGRTYNTECQLKKRACRTDNPSLAVAYRGHCQTTCNGVKCLNGLQCVEDHYTIPHCIACEIHCDDGDDADDDDEQRRNVIDPSRAVCGVDGKTYKSVCDINRMICKIGRSIAVAYPGPCRADRVTCNDINCGSRHTCLVDLLTHEPRCVSCRYKCARKRRPASLRFEEGKICGVNNRTYNSWCQMRKDSCSTGFFIDVKSAGACQ